MFKRNQDLEKSAAAAVELRERRRERDTVKAKQREEAAVRREERSRAREEAAAKRRAESAAKREERAKARAEVQARMKTAKLALKGWRVDHPAEETLNKAAALKGWPASERGVTRFGPIKSGRAEFINAGAHKGWTATRLVAGAATLGASAVATGRKNKGAAVINITFGNGAAQTYTVKPEPSYLKAANQYVNAFNALAAQLEQESVA
ncbi:hypothetical protein [Streptomyces sp. DW26H14]|uniref:hypothetical protein n=1 Tax=Streptomyces sp. DW26H14 TaxID=3435395 RepID=UPI00403DB712